MQLRHRYKTMYDQSIVPDVLCHFYLSNSDAVCSNCLDFGCLGAIVSTWPFIGFRPRAHAIIRCSCNTICILLPNKGDDTLNKLRQAEATHELIGTWFRLPNILIQNDHWWNRWEWEGEGEGQPASWWNNVFNTSASKRSHFHVFLMHEFPYIFTSLWSDWYME